MSKVVPGSEVFIKTMEGRLYGIATRADSLQLRWQSPVEMGYELDPAAAVERDQVIYVPTHSGVTYAIHAKDHSLLWKFKLSNCLINAVLPAGNKQVLVSTMDGKLALLRY